MMMDPTSIPMYHPDQIEPKWQKKWADDGLYHADIDPEKPKFYALTMPALSLWGPAHWPLVCHDTLRRARPVQAYAGL